MLKGHLCVLELKRRVHHDAQLPLSLPLQQPLQVLGAILGHKRHKPALDAPSAVGTTAAVIRLNTLLIVILPPANTYGFPSPRYVRLDENRSPGPSPTLSTMRSYSSPLPFKWDTTSVWR
uniref:Uncharacterized protein n=1 Tax=Bionectria ochroleuca TaxID=29856 RepID=A0A8H7N8J2_BIOOC